MASSSARISRPGSGQAESAAQRLVMRHQAADLDDRAMPARRDRSRGWRGGRPCPRRPGRCRAWSFRSRLPHRLPPRGGHRAHGAAAGSAWRSRRSSGCPATPGRPGRAGSRSPSRDAMGRAPRRCRSPRACRVGRCPRAAAPAYRPCRRSRAYGRRCGRPGTGPRRRLRSTASRRSCPFPRRPTGRRPRRRWPCLSVSSNVKKPRETSDGDRGRDFEGR